MTTESRSTRNGARDRNGPAPLFVSRVLSRFAPVVVVFSLVVLCACGYHLPRRGDHIPSAIRAIAIPVFKNESYEPALEDPLTDAMIREFEKNAWVDIVSTDRADAVLTGTIKEFTTAPIAFGRTTFAAEFRATVEVKIVLRDREGKDLWEDRELSVSEEYEVTTDIFVSEANKRVAIRTLGAELAEEVHDRIFDGF